MLEYELHEQNTLIKQDSWCKGGLERPGKKAREGLSGGWNKIAMRGEFGALATGLERI